MDAKLRAELDAAEWTRRQRTLATAPEPRRLRCGHIAEDLPNRPPMLDSECRFCKQEALRAQPSPKTEPRRELDPAGSYTAREWELLSAYWEAHPEKRPGGPLTELQREQLVEQMDARRQESLEREHSRDKRRGRLVSGRIEQGRWIEWREIPGQGLVKVVYS